MIAVRIYFDHNATTPIDPSVVEVMAHTLSVDFGNPSSVHHFGQRTKALIDDARSSVAALVGAEPSEIVFTSGGTEADNFALRGAAEALEPTGRRHLIASAIEHEAVLVTLKALARRGWRITLLPVDASGVVKPETLAAALTDDTAVVSVMHANNEIGTIQPVAELARLTHARGGVFHTDAVQSIGKIPVAAGALGADLLSLSAHKFNGPKGAGALWIKRGTRVTAILTGGKHERTRRAGTENVAGIVGLGRAAQLAREKLATEPARIGLLRDRLEREILAAVPGSAVNGDVSRRVPNTSNISFEGIEAEALLIALDLEGIAVSTGSACSSGTLEPSHVLRAMGLAAHRTQNSIRISLGMGNTDEHVDYFLQKLPAVVGKLRSLTGRGTVPAPAR